MRSVDSVPIIGIVNSNLSESSIEDIIWPIRDWLPVDTLDLTGNKIGDDSENFLNSIGLSESNKLLNLYKYLNL